MTDCDVIALADRELGRCPVCRRPVRFGDNFIRASEVPVHIRCALWVRSRERRRASIREPKWSLRPIPLRDEEARGPSSASRASVPGAASSPASSGARRPSYLRAIPDRREG